MTHNDDANPLASLGFTDLESRVYMLLLARFPATGYAIAKELGKAAANIYMALDSLERKGAVMADDDTVRRFRPVAPEKLLALLDQRYQTTRSLVAEKLSGLYRSSQDDRVYRLRSFEQVQQKANDVLQRAREIALVDAFPGTIDLVHDSIAEAITRGVLVGVKAYEPLVIDGAVVAVGKNAKQIMDRWPVGWLNVVADGNEYLMALLTADGKGVIQAVWTECPYLSWVHQSAFSAEIILTAMETRIESASSPDEIRTALDELRALTMPGAPGYQSILEEIKSSHKTATEDST